MKTCTKCGECKDLDQFHRSTREKDGLNAWCKVCMKAYAAARYADNKDSILTANRKWQDCNRSRCNLNAAAWRLANPQKVRAAARKQWDRTEVRERAKSRQELNRDYLNHQKRSREQKERELISPGYVAKVLRLKVSVIPRGIVDLKREQLSLHRMLRDFKQAIEGENE